MFNVSTKRFLCYLGILYIAFRLDMAHAEAANDYSYWQQSQGTVKTPSGQTAKIINFSDYNPNTKQGIAQFEAVDQQGNKKTVTKTLKLNASRFKNYALSCFRGPAACLASVAIGYAVTEVAEWAISDDNRVTYESTSQFLPYNEWSSCRGTTVSRQEVVEGRYGSVYDFDTNCIAQVRTDGKLVVRVQYPQKPVYTSSGEISYLENGQIQFHGTWNPESSELYAFYEPIHQTLEWSWVPFEDISLRRQAAIEAPIDCGDGSTQCPIRMHYETLANLTVPSTPPVVTQQLEVSPELFAQTVASPETLQTALPEFIPDVWEPVDFGTDIPISNDQTTTDPEQPPVTNPEPTPVEWAFGNPEETPLSTVSDVGSQDRSILPFFTTEQMFDATCPEPQVFDLPVHGQFELTFQPLCDIATFVKPMMILAGMIAWLGIVWRGLGA
jgi:hypothetical protein